MKKIIFRKSFLVFKILFLSLVFYLITSATYENIYVQRSIKEFINKGVYNEELSTTLRKVYIVPRETYQEKKDAYTSSIQTMRPGSSGDILVAVDSPFPELPVAHQLMSFFIGGHSAIKAGIYNDYDNTIRVNDVIDIAGLSDIEELNVAMSDDGAYWMDSSYRNRFIGLRVKCTEEQRKIALNEAISLFGDKYNYKFVLNTYDSHYCSDLVSKAYKRAGIDLNKDKLGTTIFDLIVSDYTYIFMYKYTDNNYVDHIYYIDDRN